VDKVWQFAPEDISREFVIEHSNIFSNNRGCGLWLWKPYLIHMLMDKFNDGEIIVYSDAGVSFIRNISPLIDTLEKSEYGMLFFGLPLLNEEWTKSEAFVEAGYTPKVGEVQVDGCFFILKVSAVSRRLVKEWFDLCCNEVILSPEWFYKDIQLHPKFQSHREDQSVLSIVVNRNAIPLYRDPSDYGEFPFQYKHPKGKWTYVRVKYRNSTYPTITLHHRSVPFEPYYRTYRRKHILSCLGLWNEWTSNLKNQ